MKNLLFVGFILLLSLSAFGRGSHHHKDRLEKMIKELNLTEDQIQKLKDHHAKVKGTMKPLYKEKRALKEQIQNAFIEGKSDEEIKKIHQKMIEFKNKKMDFKLNKLLFLKSILTKEQREQFIELKKKRKKHHWNKQ